MIQRGQDTLCPSHKWEQVCNERKSGSCHGRDTLDKPVNHNPGAAKDVAPTALLEQANSGWPRLLPSSKPWSNVGYGL